MLIVVGFCSILLNHNPISSPSGNDNDLNIVYLNKEVGNSSSNIEMENENLNPLMLDIDNDYKCNNKHVQKFNY